MGFELKPISTIKANLGLEPNGRVQKFFTNTCYKHMDKYVPRDEGNLRTNVDIQSDKIIYQSIPYAKIQYYGIINGSPIKNYTTAGTGPYWDKKMVTAEMQDVVREVQEYVGGRR